jgi:hypothetical protein
MNKMKVLALVITCVVVAIGCEGCDDGYIPDIFEGTWTGTSTNQGQQLSEKIVAGKGTFTWYTNNDPSVRGTYTVSGNTVTMITTHQWSPFTSLWNSFSGSSDGVISGNTFTSSSGGTTTTFTRQ